MSSLPASGRGLGGLFLALSAFALGAGEDDPADDAPDDHGTGSEQWQQCGLRRLDVAVGEDRVEHRVANSKFLGFIKVSFYA